MKQNRSNVIYIILIFSCSYIFGLSKPLTSIDVVMQYLIDISDNDVVAIYFCEKTKIYDDLKLAKNLKDTKPIDPDIFTTVKVTINKDALYFPSSLIVGTFRDYEKMEYPDWLKALEKEGNIEKLDKYLDTLTESRSKFGVIFCIDSCYNISKIEKIYHVKIYYFLPAIDENNKIVQYSYWGDNFLLISLHVKENKHSFTIKVLDSYKMGGGPLTKKEKDRLVTKIYKKKN